MAPRRRASTAPDPSLIDKWLDDGADLAPADALLAYSPDDIGDAERYCLALYHQMAVPARSQIEFDALWTRSAQLDRERRLLKAAYNLSLLDVCYDALRHANLFGRFVRPRPRLSTMIEESRCLQAFYNESATRSQSMTFVTSSQYVKDFIRNLLLMAFLLYTLGSPTELLPKLTTMPKSAKVFAEVAIVAAALCIVVSALRLVLRLPKFPRLLVTDEYSAAILREGAWAFIRRSIIADLLDEILNRWMGVFALAFLLSLLDLAMTHFVGSFVMIAALVGVILERCSLRAILIVGGLAAVTVYAQFFNISLLWTLGKMLRLAFGKILSPLSFSLPEAILNDRPDLLTALVLSPIRLPKTLTLQPWSLADFFLEPCQMIISALFWSIALTNGLLAALISRFVFSVVAGFILFMRQGPVAFEFVGKTRQQ